MACWGGRCMARNDAMLLACMHACAQKIDVSKEDPDHTADRLVQFLKIVKYKPPASLDP